MEGKNTYLYQLHFIGPRLQLQFIVTLIPSQSVHLQLQEVNLIVKEMVW